jgi:chromosomal replication initiator protein
MDAWQQIKDRLSSRLPWESFQSWFTQTSYGGEDGTRLLVSVPNRETKDWIEREFGAHVISAARDLQLRYSQVDFVVPGDAPASSPASSMNGHTAAQYQSRDTDGSMTDPLFGSPTQLIERYDFSQFVVGSCNQFAHAAAKAVAEQPARRYNPLFIYGNSGVGKTHLLHAIGRSLHDRFGKTRVVCTTGERFMNQLIQCIRTDRMSFFHQHYRSADVLLVDDVHVLAGKERTQEEFFHTFNDLYDHQKQIVMTSDSAPKQTPGLVERLRSRFEWGLMVDIQAPDLETKLAILDKKAELEGVRLPDEVRLLIATKTKANVRELESALVKLVAYSSVTQSDITIDMARQALRHMAGAPERRTSIESIIKAVAEHFQMLPAQIKQKSNQRHIAFPRQVAMYLVKELTPASLPEIGRAFGGKHHTTVLHSVQKIERDRLLKPDLNKSIQTILDSFA